MSAMWKRCVEACNPFKVARLVADLSRNARRASRESGAGLLQIAREQTALYLLNNLNRKEYYMYRLYSPKLSWEEKKAFIGEREAGKFWNTLTPRKYQEVFKNKIIFRHVFHALGLPLAEFYGAFEPAWGRGVEGEPLRNAAELRALIERRGLDEFVIKPVEASRGNMVTPLRRQGESFISPRGDRFSVESLVAYVTDEGELRRTYPYDAILPRAFCIEERLHPHPGMLRFAKETLCGIRCLTLRTLDGQVCILGAAFKLPVGDVGVDNLSQGGMAIGVDVETGTLTQGVFDGDVTGTLHTRHPRTNVEFAGFRLPAWPETRETALRAAAAFPWVHVVGWDIAITARGPVIIEGNSQWGPEHLQLTSQRGLYRGAFKETYDRLCAMSARKAPR